MILNVSICGTRELALAMTSSWSFPLVTSSPHASTASLLSSSWHFWFWEDKKKKSVRLFRCHGQRCLEIPSSLLSSVSVARSGNYRETSSRARAIWPYRSPRRTSARITNGRDGRDTDQFIVRRPAACVEYVADDKAKSNERLEALHHWV